jgi:hypothetical protein
MKGQAMTASPAAALPLVAQLRFTRSEFLRGLEGLTDEDARKRVMPMNCIAWMIGHLAWQEHNYWLKRAQGKEIAPELEEIAGWSHPATTPALVTTMDAWRRVTAAGDEYLDSLTAADLERTLVVEGRLYWENIGTMIQRCIYHYWYHLGEVQAVRQMLGHSDLAEYVGDIGVQAPYRGA